MTLKALSLNKKITTDQAKFVRVLICQKTVSMVLYLVTSFSSNFLSPFHIPACKYIFLLFSSLSLFSFLPVILFRYFRILSYSLLFLPFSLPQLECVSYIFASLFTFTCSPSYSVSFPFLFFASSFLTNFPSLFFFLVSKFLLFFGLFYRPF